MTLNCTDLVARGIIVDDAIIGDYASNIPGPVVYLEEDIDSFLDPRYLNDPIFYQWMWIIAIFVVFYSFMISCILYPRRMSSQKRVQLEILQSDGFIDAEFVLPVLNQYSGDQQYISELILNFAGFRLIYDMDQWIRRKHAKHRNSKNTFIFLSQPTWHYFVRFLLSGTLLYALFIPFYLVVNHWNNSYILYLKTECTLYWLEDTWNDRLSKSQTEINIHSLCSSATLHAATPYTFYLKSDRYDSGKANDAFYSYYSPTDRLDGYPEWSQDGHCFVNKNNFKVRQPLIDCCCSDSDECTKSNDRRNRCGRGCKVQKKCDIHCCCDCANCCGYCGALFCFTGCGCYLWCCVLNNLCFNRYEKFICGLGCATDGYEKGEQFEKFVSEQGAEMIELTTRGGSVSMSEV